MDNKNRFVLRNREKEELNQYWYSPKTIQVIVDEVEGKTVFLSTPSIYFSLPKEVRKNCHLFDLDAQWKTEPNFFQYDFNKPEEIPEKLYGSFDMAVIDPPFITREVWEKYSAAVSKLLKPDAKILATTIAENAPFMQDLLDVSPQTFKPSIPHLVYQYRLYTNYESETLQNRNEEIPEE